MSEGEAYAENYADSELIDRDLDDEVEGHRWIDIHWMMQCAYVAGFDKAMDVARERLR